MSCCGIIKRIVARLIDGDGPPSNNSRLLRAAVHGDMSVVLALLDEEDVDVNYRDDLTGWTSLREACRANYLELAKLLIEKGGADVNIGDNCGETALHRACFDGNLEIFKLLIEHGAQVNCETNVQWTTLHVACYGEQLEIAKLLFANGAADVLGVVDRDGKTPFHLALELQFWEMAKLMIANGFDVNGKDEESGKSPLHYEYWDWTPKLEPVKFLIEQGAEVNCQDKEGETPLHRACADGNFEVVQLLLRRGADMNAKSKQGTTPLQVACEQDDLNVVWLMIRENPSRLFDASTCKS